MKITGVGNSVVDLFSQVPDGFPGQLGLTPGARTHLPWDELDELRKKIEPPHRMAGGSAATTLKLASLLGAEATLILRTGLDPESQLLETELKDNDVDLILDRVHGRTGICCSLIEPDGRTTVIANPGSGPDLPPGQVPPGLVEASDLLYLEGYQLKNRELFHDLLHRAARAGVDTALDLCCPPFIREHRRELTDILGERVDILFLNREEGAALAGLDKPNSGDEAEAVLQRLGELCRTVVLKLDRQGALVGQGGKIFRKNTLELKPVDVTGAGDAFAAGYLTGLAEGISPRACCERGHYLGGRIISQIGTRITAPVLREVEDAFLSMD